MMDIRLSCFAGVVLFSGLCLGGWTEKINHVYSHSMAGKALQNALRLEMITCEIPAAKRDPYVKVEGNASLARSTSYTRTQYTYPTSNSSYESITDVQNTAPYLDVAYVSKLDFGPQLDIFSRISKEMSQGDVAYSGAATTLVEQGNRYQTQSDITKTNIGLRLNWQFIGKTAHEDHYADQEQDIKKKQAFLNQCQLIDAFILDFFSSVLDIKKALEFVRLNEESLDAFEKNISVLKSQYQSGLISDAERIKAELKKQTIKLELDFSTTDIKRKLEQFQKDYDIDWSADFLSLFSSINAVIPDYLAPDNVFIECERFKTALEQISLIKETTAIDESLSVTGKLGQDYFNAIGPKPVYSVAVAYATTFQDRKDMLQAEFLKRKQELISENLRQKTQKIHDQAYDDFQKLQKYSADYQQARQLAGLSEADYLYQEQLFNASKSSWSVLMRAAESSVSAKKDFLSAENRYLKQLMKVQANLNKLGYYSQGTLLADLRKEHR